MSHERFRTVVKALITHRGRVLLGKKEVSEDHPIGGKWHVLGGHLEKGEQPEEAVKREVKEETGLEVDVHQVVDISTFAWEDGENDSIQIFYHVEADNDEAEPMDDLEEVEWVEPEDLKDELSDLEASRFEDRNNLDKFVEKMIKAPVF